jgi:hypothetical protein
VRPTIRLFGPVVAAAAFASAACGGEGTGPGERLDDASLAAVTALPLDAAGMNTPSGGTFPAPSCTWAREEGRYGCQPVSHEGVTITRSYAFVDRSARPQRRYDPVTTASIVSEVRVLGTVMLPGAAGEMTVDSRRWMTVSGLEGEETTQILNGTGVGTTQARSSGAGLSPQSTTYDTTLNVVVPVQPRPVTGATPQRVIPLSGQRINNAKSMTTRNGQPYQVEWRSVITYTGTRMASLEMWYDGERQSCQLDLLNPASVCVWTLPG